MDETREQKLERKLTDEQHKNMQAQINKIEKYVVSIDQRVKEANHKTRKIVIALVLAFGLIVGLMSSSLEEVIKIFT